MDAGSNISGYYRYPTIHDQKIVFVCEDDLWIVHAEGGIARRLTSNLGEVSRPWLSPDGRRIAFVGREEGQPEIYLMDAEGGPARRLTYMSGSLCITAGWSPEGKILFANNAGHWYLRFTHLYQLDPSDGITSQLTLGPARAVSFGPSGGIVLGRNTDEPARWKRYRGGTAGQIWIDENGTGNFHPLLNLNGNITSPIWLTESDGPGRIYFISDHEGFGNLYSVLPSGQEIRRHTHHENFYVRNANSDGNRIVYHAGADLYLYDPKSDSSEIVKVEFHSPRTQRNRKFIEPAKFLGDHSLHPNGQAVAITSRGKLFSFANWEGAVIQHGPDETSRAYQPPTSVRYRLPVWLSDGDHLIAVTDQEGEEQFVIFDREENNPDIVLSGLDIGRPEQIVASPCKNQIVFSNHRYELLFLDLETNDLRLIDRGHSGQMSGFGWSPDGEWVVYSISLSMQTQGLKLWKASSNESYSISRPILRDVAPAFDPKGNYIYFLSYRTFEPVSDNLHFDLGFPWGIKPYLITLKKDQLSPFIPRPRLTGNNEPEKTNGNKPKETEEQTKDRPEEATENDQETEPSESDLIQIDLDGIEDRIIAFPVQEAVYGRIAGLADGKAVYSRFPLQSALEDDSPNEPGTKGILFTYNFEEQKEEQFTNGVSDFLTSTDGKWIIIRSGNRLRVIKSSEKPNNEGDGLSRKSGWINLNRMKVSILPGGEWRQMFREAWRLQRDQFWIPDMAEVDWLDVHNRYLSLVDRVSSRSEFSDLMWEMQGELGTSHAYEFGGDYRPEPSYYQGYLGADYEFDVEKDAWKITHIYHGDPWNPRIASPLLGPGINVAEGDYLLEVNGQKLSRTFPPAAALVNRPGDEVTLKVQSIKKTDEEDAPANSENNRVITVKTLSGEMQLRYRDWVENNRRYVHQATGDRIGYVHIPDMGGPGYAEFHRGYLGELDHEGLIIDIRFNRGGYVSALLLEKLARRRIGYDKSRWGQTPFPYPPDSVLGPLIAVTNEYAGSDGDIFSHGFKLMKLGKLIGKRTWGGVIGINPRHFLVDGTLTTQPEFSFWFKDVGWGVENYGTDPDIEVDITPQDYNKGVDTQLDRAIQEIMDSLQSNLPTFPDLSSRPSRAVPRLPKS